MPKAWRRYRSCWPLGRPLPHLFVDLRKHTFERTVEHLVEVSEAAIVDKWVTVDRASVHNDLLLDLLTNAPQPPLLRPSPWTVVYDLCHRRPHAICIRHQRIAQRCLSDEGDDGCGNVLVLGLQPCSAK